MLLVAQRHASLRANGLADARAVEAEQGRQSVAEGERAPALDGRHELHPPEVSLCGEGLVSHVVPKVVANPLEALVRCLLEHEHQIGPRLQRAESGWRGERGAGKSREEV